jgi:Flp pilus assembly secretin CpaC/tetratricopeptide (TPR) repeat protein
MLLAVFPGAVQLQLAALPLQNSAQNSVPSVDSDVKPPASPENQPDAVKGTKVEGQASVLESKGPRSSDRRRAAKLYLASSKLFAGERFEEALRGYQQAARLDPSNPDYALAVEVARSHTITALIQVAAKARLRGDAAAARAALAHALEVDPKNAQVGEHLRELADDALLGLGQSTPIYEEAANMLGAETELEPKAGVQSFHLRAGQRQIIQQVFKAYGIEATVDDSVSAGLVRLDVDDAGFEDAARLVSLTTASFYVPLDAHRALVAADTREKRQQFIRQQLETLYLPGLTEAQLTDVGNLAKNVFDAQQMAIESTGGTITLRAPEKTLTAFNTTLQALLEGHSQVMLEIRLIQVAHSAELKTGVQPPQQITAFNAYSAEQSILNSNSALVKQIVSSGLASPGDTLAIIGILLASGQVSSSLFSNGVALFGGGLTLSGLSPAPATVNLNLNSSDSRQLDYLQLRLGDGEDGTVRSGERYPIQTSSFSTLSSSGSSISGLTAAGSSSALSSLLSSVSSALTVPQVQYEDLGLTLKTTPRVMRNNDVALTIEMKIDALSGVSLNGNPELNNRAYSGVVTLKEGEGVIVASELTKSETRAISGTPGISEIPGLNNITEKDTQKSYATLLIVITPHVVRGPRTAGSSPALRMDYGTPAH